MSALGDGPAAFQLVPLPTSIIEVLHRPPEPAQHTAIRFGERLLEARALASIGSVGGSYDNALPESLIGLYRTECVQRGGPIRAAADLEPVTASRAHWFNTSRLHSGLGHIPPVEYEQNYAHQRAREDPISGEPSLQ